MQSRERELDKTLTTLDVNSTNRKYNARIDMQKRPYQIRSLTGLCSCCVSQWNAGFPTRSCRVPKETRSTAYVCSRVDVGGARVVWKASTTVRRVVVIGNVLHTRSARNAVDGVRAVESTLGCLKGVHDSPKSFVIAVSVMFCTRGVQVLPSPSVAKRQSLRLVDWLGAFSAERFCSRITHAH